MCTHETLIIEGIAWLQFPYRFLQWTIRAAYPYSEYKTRRFWAIFEFHGHGLINLKMIDLQAYPLYILTTIASLIVTPSLITKVQNWNFARPMVQWETRDRVPIPAQEPRDARHTSETIFRAVLLRDLEQCTLPFSSCNCRCLAWKEPR